MSLPVISGATRPTSGENVLRSAAVWRVANTPTSNTVIAPRSYLLVWCDSRNNAPGLHTGFGLNADGQIVALYGLSKTGPVLRDLVKFGLQ